MSQVPQRQPCWAALYQPKVRKFTFLITNNFLYTQHFCHQLCGFSTSTSAPILCRHQRRDLRFNSFLTPTTQSQCRPHRLRAHKVVPTLGAGHKVSTRLSWLQTMGPHSPFLTFNNLVINAHKIHENNLLICSGSLYTLFSDYFPL